MIIPEVEDRFRLRAENYKPWLLPCWVFYFMFKAVVAAVYWVFWFSSVRSMGFDPAADQWASVLKTLAELVLACLLVFGARGLTVLIRKVRGPEIS